MDCNCKPNHMCPPRPQMPMPPSMNTNCANCSCGTIPAQLRPQPSIQPSILPPVLPPIQPPVQSPVQPPVQPRRRLGNTVENPDSYPIAMAYVPWQTWKQTYPPEQSLQRGTVFPELDLPFVMGRCR